METKEKIKVLFTLDSDGYIIGYQQEFYDGKEWQAPFDTSKAVDLAPADVQTIVLGATKYTDGKLVLDTAKRDELTSTTTTTAPIDYATQIANLQAQVDQANEATMELADMLLSSAYQTTSMATSTKLDSATSTTSTTKGTN